MGQSLVQAGANIEKWSNVKLGQTLLQSRAVSRYYKARQNLLRSEAGNLLQSETIVDKKCGNYYKAWHLLQSRANLSISGVRILTNRVSITK